MNEEKETTLELDDSEMDSVAGGNDSGTAVVTCTFCRLGRIPIPASGPWAALCPHCGANLICFDGVLQLCIPAQKSSASDWDTDDNWL